MRPASSRGLRSVVAVVLLGALLTLHQKSLTPFAPSPPDALVPGAALRLGAPRAPAAEPPAPDLALRAGWRSLAAAAGPQPMAAAAPPDFLTVDFEPRAGAEADPRFASVVLIEPERGFGSGFYIAPYWILTNAHVVDAADVVKVTTYEGITVQGRVVRRDRERDLALLQVGYRGRPVILFTGPKLRVGSPVEVIGHPEGFRYSLTRGVISAVRRHAGVAGVERRKVLHIQTDAVINLGNSGGPLFLGDQVVGINAWRWGSHGGLSFAVHCREILDFLAEDAALPGLVAQNGP
jgi:S1-C subfamily serine protease